MNHVLPDIRSALSLRVEQLLRVRDSAWSAGMVCEVAGEM